MQTLRQLFSNPVLAKEYQWRMRSLKTPWIVSIYLLIIGAIVLSVLALFTNNPMWFDSQTNKWMFIGLSGVQLLMMAFVVPGITAGLISGERERQTLSVLLTTNLSSSQIILSKWISSLSFMMLLLFASLPLYIIVYMYGGISPDHVWKAVLHLFVTMIFLGSMGIFYSTLIKRTGVATILAYVTVALIGIGLLIALYLISMFYVQFVLQPNPGQPPSAPLIAEIVAGLHPATSLIHGLTEEELDFFIQGIGLDLNLYYFYLITYFVLSIVLLVSSIYLLSPIRFRAWRWKKRSQAAEVQAKAQTL